jgi:DNA-binding FrmR family transcriptional regulator
MRLILSVATFKFRIRDRSQGFRHMAKKASRAGSSGSDSSASNRKKFAIQPHDKAANLLHLRRIKGQIEGIQRMVEEDRYCADIIIQVTAARASLQTVTRSLLNCHLEACRVAAGSAKDGRAAAHMYQEFVDLVSKMSK